jgi:hypothetical protein
MTHRGENGLICRNIPTRKIIEPHKKFQKNIFLFNIGKNFKLKLKICRMYNITFENMIWHDGKSFYFLQDGHEGN